MKRHSRFALKALGLLLLAVFAPAIVLVAFSITIPIGIQLAGKFVVGLAREILRDIPSQDPPLGPDERLPDPVTRYWLEDLERQGRALLNTRLPREVH